MAVAGRKPKEGAKRNRVPPRHDWTEVQDRPYEGPRPNLGRRHEGRWPAATRRWWEVISRMPHCVLWTEADWQFALDTAEVHARWVEGNSPASELRIRESRMGTTLDARRDLRIRYVAGPAAEEVAEQDAGLVRLDDYRAL